MGFYDSIEVSASGLTAQRLIMDVESNNIANANTTRTPGGGPFKRQLVILQAKTDPSSEASGESDVNAGGVAVQQITSDQGPDRLVYDPSNPDSDRQGFVHMPNIQVVKEMVDLIAASQAYQANVTAIQEARQLDSQTMNILSA